MEKNLLSLPHSLNYCKKSASEKEQIHHIRKDCFVSLRTEYSPQDEPHSSLGHLVAFVRPSLPYTFGGRIQVLD